MRTPARALLLAALLFLAGCKETLYSRLAEAEAVEIMAVLMRNGIDTARIPAKDGTHSVQVDRVRLADAVQILRAHQLPRQKFATMGEVFQQQGLIASPTEERARFIYALSQELSHTLSQVDGVRSARVHVVLPHNDPLRQEEAPAAAAVFIRHDAGQAMEDILPQIKLLVANSIQGLSYDKVTVVLLPVATPAPLPDPAPAGLSVEDWVATMPLGLALGAAGTVTVLGAGAGTLLLRRRRSRTGSALAIQTPA